MNKKIIILIGCLFLIGFTIAFTSLSDNYKIEKFGDKYNIYSIREITTISQVENKIVLLEDRKLELQDVITLKHKDICIKDCPFFCEVDFNDFKTKEKCLSFCEGMCEFNYEYYNKEVENIDKEVIEIQDKLNVLKKIK